MNRATPEEKPGAPVPPPPPPAGKTRAAVHWIIFAVLAVGVSALDLWTKDLVFRVLHVQVVPAPAGGRPALRSDPPIPVIPDLFEIEASVNTGAFSGWFSGKMTFLTILSAVAILAIIGFLWSHLRGPGPHRLAFTAAIGLLWAGAAGNLYDRALLGYVRDFVKWFVVVGGKPWVWPNFNIADSAICVGVGLILLLFILDARAKPAPASAKDPGRR